MTSVRPASWLLVLALLPASGGCADGDQAPKADREDAVSEITVGYQRELTDRQIAGMAGTGDRFTPASRESLPDQAKMDEPELAGLASESVRHIDALVLGYLDSDTPAHLKDGRWHRTFDHRLVWLMVSTGPAFVSGPLSRPRPKGPPPQDQMWSAYDPLTGKFLGAKTLAAPEDLVERAP